jgi:hypothetical protein
VVADYLSRETGCSVAILGIEPFTTEFGEILSPRMESAVNEAAELLSVYFSAGNFFT